jgi:hypothetical protein
MAATYTVKKAKRDAGAQHVGAEKFRHPRRSSGQIYVNFSYLSTWMTEFSVTGMQGFCIR